jgi:CheY-like chemotaxis protein
MSHLKRILLVEDDDRDAELTLQALGTHNLANEVVVVRDGAEALDYMFRRGGWVDRPQGEPVVVLLDLKLPKVDGLEVLRALKADEQLQVVPVVILTSSREERDIIEGYRLGTSAYVVKPVAFPAFVDAVKQLGVFWVLINEPPPGTAGR